MTTRKYNLMSASASTDDMNTAAPTSLTIKANPNGKLSVKGLALWSTGTFFGIGSGVDGDTFTTSDLDAMVQAHNEVGGDLRPRVYAGHHTHAYLKMLARPQGEITALRRVGRFLLADHDNVSPDFWRKATADGARLSPDVRLNYSDQKSGKTYPLSVVGLGVLGAVSPANMTLPALDGYDLATHYADGAQQRAYGDGVVRSYSGLTLPADQNWKTVALEALKAAQDLDDDDEEDEAEYAAARYARQRGQHRNPEPEGFPEFMTPPLDPTPRNALKNALDFLITDMINARSFAAMGAKKTRPGGATWKDKAGGPDWHGERHRHPTLDAAHRYGQALGIAVLHVAKRLKKTLADDPRKHLAHLAHGLAHALHPGGEE